jgi:hypothetical protein
MGTSQQLGASGEQIQQWGFDFLHERLEAERARSSLVPCLNDEIGELREWLHLSFFIDSCPSVGGGDHKRVLYGLSTNLRIA